jgi:hypothetical protein
LYPLLTLLTLIPQITFHIHLTKFIIGKIIHIKDRLNWQNLVHIIF